MIQYRTRSLGCLASVIRRRPARSERGAEAQGPQPPGSPDQISDHLLRLLVVPEHLRSDALDANQAGDRLVVLALPSVGDSGFDVNLASTAHEAGREPVGVDLVGDLDSTVGLIKTHSCGQRVRPDVGGTEPRPRMVPVRAQTLCEVAGIGEILTGGPCVTLSRRGDRRDEQQGAAHRQHGGIAVAQGSEVVSAYGSDLLCVRSLASGLESAGELVRGCPLQGGRAAVGRRGYRAIGGQPGARHLMELGRKLCGEHEGPPLSGQHSLLGSLVLRENGAARA